MEHLLLSVHVVAGIVFVGGSAVATSLFPRYAPVAAGGPDPESVRSKSVAVALHRITGNYAKLAIIVPVIGIVLATIQGRMNEIWITTAMVTTAIAGGLLAVQIYPMQREALDEPDDGKRLRVLSMLAGIYNLLWTAVVVLMIVRPGSAS
ncbi:hypothetical protein [Nocardia rhizosphaerihabitans]|uniref:Membrane protein n=1 Tax=Nocardia rhizosphaerihabitans TaxID=1691570 RepID=A0ABQ2KCB1_9NOCA|nr:hypothetical protein [Nocardia rhizosphaerihabitans]GGN76546.1 membrane protein [Nocardia rhizosphaerihabitans]